MKQYGCPNVVDGKVCGCVDRKKKKLVKGGKSFAAIMKIHIRGNPQSFVDSRNEFCEKCGHEYTEPGKVEG